MSIALMTAAWALDIKPTDKLVLLALADWANESDGGRCWPSIKKLCERSSLCERAVQSALKRLVAAGHLTRVENPGKGVNYFVHPAVGSGMRGVDLPEYHYVYRTENPETGQFYIGARSSLDRIENDKYMGSGVWVKASIAAGARLVKSILEQYPSREALAHGEVAHTALVIANPLCMNAKMPSAGNLTKKFNGDTPALDAPRTSCAPHQMYLTPALDAPNTLGTIKTKKATLSKSIVLSDFDDFWKAYPLKVAKLKAAAAYAKAIKRGVDPQAMLQAASAYAASPCRDPDFTKHAATWLNAGCYDDQPQENCNGRPNAPANLQPSGVSDRLAAGLRLREQFGSRA